MTIHGLLIGVAFDIAGALAACASQAVSHTARGNCRQR
jgi:hypothetical protein